MGKKVSDTVLRKALAADADELILLEDEAFEKLDSYSTATALAGAIRKIGKYDLILTGRQAGDWDSGTGGPDSGGDAGTSRASVWPGKSRVEDGSVVVKKSLPDGYERVKAKMPALVTVSNEVGELRYISRTKMLKTMKGSGAISTWSAGDSRRSRGSAQEDGDCGPLLSSRHGKGLSVLLEGSVEDQAGKLAEVFMSLR